MNTAYQTFKVHVLNSRTNETSAKIPRRLRIYVPDGRCR